MDIFNYFDKGYDAISVDPDLTEEEQRLKMLEYVDHLADLGIVIMTTDSRGNKYSNAEIARQIIQVIDSNEMLRAIDFTANSKSVAEDVYKLAETINVLFGAGIELRVDPFNYESELRNYRDVLDDIMVVLDRKDRNLLEASSFVVQDLKNEIDRLIFNREYLSTLQESLMRKYKTLHDSRDKDMLQHRINEIDMMKQSISVDELRNELESLKRIIASQTMTNDELTKSSILKRITMLINASQARDQVRNNMDHARVDVTPQQLAARILATDDTNNREAAVDHIARLLSNNDIDGLVNYILTPANRED
jgi:hypothetical protein